MRAPSPHLCVIILAALLAVPAAAAGTQERNVLVDELARRLADTTLHDEKRIAAREQLVSMGAAQKLLELGKTAESENVRVHVAIALSALPTGREQAITGNLDLLSTWLAEAEDAALRYWAAMAIAAVPSQKALDILTQALKGQKPSSRLRAAIARVIGGWGGEFAEPARKVILGLLDSEDPDARIAAIEALRANEVKNKEVIQRIYEVAKKDEREPVWRAALLALDRLEEVVPKLLGKLPPGASDQARQRELMIWERRWKRLLRDREREAEGG
ncbi:MAG: HEAT repeat domain-containing protein [bacterium]